MSWVDIGIVAVLLGSAILGYRRGLVKQFVELGGLVAGVLLALYLTGGLVTSYAQPLAAYRITYPVVFLAIVGIALLVASVIGRVAGEVMEVTFFGWFDQLGGGIAGLAKGMLWTSIWITIAFHMNVSPRVDDNLRRSNLAGPLSKMLPAAFEIVKSYAHDAPLREPFQVEKRAPAEKRVAKSSSN